MNNLEKIFGIQISIREEVDAESLFSYKDILERLMQFIDFDIKDYFVYVHFITIKEFKHKKYFGNSLALKDRVNALTLIYKVNPKQRLNMKFYNEYGSFKFDDGMRQIPEESQVQFIFDSSHIHDGVLETKLITFLKREFIRPDHMKIKLEVRPHPTIEFEKRLQTTDKDILTPRIVRRRKTHRANTKTITTSSNNSDKADAYTAIDLHFSKNLKFTIPQILVAIDQNPMNRYPESVETFITEQLPTIDNIMANNWNIHKSKMVGEYELKLIKVKKWFENFLPSEFNLALKIMEKINFYSNKQVIEWIAILAETIKTKFKNNLSGLYFLGMGDSPSDSGSRLLYPFRKALKLTEESFPTDFSKIETNNTKALIFIDDIIGSGKQASTFYSNKLQGIGIDCFYCALIGFENGIKYIEREAGYKQVITAKKLFVSDQAFSSTSRFFPDEVERELIKKLAYQYGTKLYPKGPLGYNDCEALIAFEHNVPNNTLPLIWANAESEKEVSMPWNALFARNKI